jgi:hypothetical protein
MATTNQGWALPTVGGSQDTWGTTLNTTIQAIDTLVGTVTATEISYLDGLTSNAQTQINTLTSQKAALSGANFTGAVDVNAAITANSLVIDNGASDWSFEIESNVLYFKFAGTKKAKLDSSGNLTVAGDITAFGTV